LAGQIVILNGAPRSGKSSIAAVIQETFDGVWMNVGMDIHIMATPPAYRPGVGLRPQLPEHQRPDSERVSVETLEERIPALYTALYESAAAHARVGLNVVMDVNHHDDYSKPLGVFPDCAAGLAGLRVLFVGVLCPLDVLWERRKETWGQDRDEVGSGVVASVELGYRAASEHTYDLEVDTSRLSPRECAEAIRTRLIDGPAGKALAGRIA
jgi:chloramphenicol 3-O phosphotransferase